jgi:hypothetical protein
LDEAIKEVKLMGEPEE